MPLSTARRSLLLGIYCLAQFMESCSNTAIFSALPKLQKEMDLNEGEVTWVVAGFTLTFASFLLVSGRIGDVYGPST